MQQTDQGKYACENKFYCELHSDCQLLSINFQEKQTRKSRLLCAKCMIDVINKQEKVEQLVYIQDLINDPTNAMLKVTKPAESESKIDENEALSEIEKLLVRLEDSIRSQLIIIRQNIQQMRSQVCSITTELSNNLKLNELVKQFELVRSMDSYQGTNELIQLEEQLNQISANLMNTYVSAKQKVYDIISFIKYYNQQLIVSNYQNNFKMIQNEVELINKISLELFNKIVSLDIHKIISLDIPKNILDEIKQFPQIHQLISDGKQIKYELLYQGTRDGMNSQNYWSKCNKQSNLLTIMTSNNGNRFGGYSPCLINSEYTGVVQDPTMKSFLFQYNKKQIYRLKVFEKAIGCYGQYGPYYGGERGSDFCIAGDFNGGSSSKLGTSYDISNYNIVDKSSHIFGAATPQLQEIKVFKVIFQ